MICQCIICMVFKVFCLFSNFLQLPYMSQTSFHTFLYIYEVQCQAEIALFSLFPKFLVPSLQQLYLSSHKIRYRSQFKRNNSNIVYHISSLDFRFQKQLLPARLVLRWKLPSCRNNQRLCLLQIPPAQQLSPCSYWRTGSFYVQRIGIGMSNLRLVAVKIRR